MVGSSYNNVKNAIRYALNRKIEEKIYKTVEKSWNSGYYTWVEFLFGSGSALQLELTREHGAVLAISPPAKGDV